MNKENKCFIKAVPADHSLDESERHDIDMLSFSDYDELMNGTLGLSIMALYTMKHHAGVKPTETTDNTVPMS